MSRLHSLLLILGRTTAEQKVGSFLRNIKERVGNGVADRRRPPGTRYDIANYLALSVETVSRSLTGLKERGVIALSGPREVRIIDRDAIADERNTHEVLAWPSAVERRTPSPLRDAPHDFVPCRALCTTEFHTARFLFGLGTGPLGERSASIAHEINQPLGAIVANGSAA
jgi:hypothetical protein